MSDHTFLSVQDALERAEALLSISKSPRTIQNYKMWFERFFDYAKPDNVLSLKLFDFQDYLLYIDNSENYAPKTYNVAVYALRFLYSSVLGRTFTKEQLPKKSGPKFEKPTFTYEQALTLFEQTDDPELKAAIGLGFSCGLRICEITRLKYGDFNKTQKIILISNSKHNRSRYVPYPDSIAECLRAYCRSRNISNPDPNAYIFCNKKKPEKPIKNSALTRRFMDHLQTFGFYIPGLSFHRLRHVFATELSMRNVPLPTIGKIMGHASVATTANYIHMSEDIKKEFPDLLVHHKQEDRDEG